MLILHPSFRNHELVRIALIADPFIAVPPTDYGGTELFIAHLADGLKAAGIEVILYANGESNVKPETRWLYERSPWPIKNPEHASTRQLNHTS